jgi:integrase
MSKTILESHKHPKYPRLYIQLRQRSRFYQSVVFLDDRKQQKSLQTDQLATAFKLGEQWYRKMLRASVADARQHPFDRLATDATMAELFSSFRLPLLPKKRAYVDQKWSAIAEFWRTWTVTEVTTQTFKEFYAWRRRRKTPLGTVPTNHTLHKDMMVIRQLLTYAIEEEQISALPLIPKIGKIDTNPRPWLERVEWEHLISTSQARIKEVENNRRLKRFREDLDDFLMFMIESMMRVDEMRALTVGQCRLVPATDDGQLEYLVINVKGKTGHRNVVAGGFAPIVFESRRQGRKPTDLLWPVHQRDAFRELLIAAGLRTDVFGHTRNLKSIRATAISFRILAQAPTPNLLLIARNAGTSVAMIDQFYARRLTAEMGAQQLSAVIGV